LRKPDSILLRTIPRNITALFGGYKRLNRIVNVHSGRTKSATKTNENSAQRDANTARAGCSKVRTPPAVINAQTQPITIHCAAAS